MRYWPWGKQSSSDEEEEEAELLGAAADPGRGSARVDDVDVEVVDLLDIPIEACEDIYEMVAAAAFGGITFREDDDKSGSTAAHIYIHPFVLLVVFCVPLFIMQACSLLVIMLEFEPSFSIDWVASPMLIKVKLFLIVVLQFMLFDELYHAARLCCFIINPTTWMDRVRSIKSPFATCPVMTCAAVALAMKAAIGYSVCVLSVSVVLSTTAAVDAIFNSLALTFLVDLDEELWAVCKTLFILQLDDDFHFQLRKARAKEQAERGASPCMCLYTGMGARHLEMLFTMAFMMYLYARQIFVVAYAMETGIVPAVRDVCSLWELTTEGHGFSFVGEIVALCLELLYSGYALALAQAADPEGGGYCTDDLLTNSQNFAVRGALIRAHPRATILPMFIMSALLLGPHVYWVYRKRTEAKLDAIGLEQGIEDETLEGVAAEVRRLEAEEEEDDMDIKELQKRVAQLEELLRESTGLRSRSSRRRSNK